jgi:steroid delta-isomerase-like uncharacterized protein
MHSDELIFFLKIWRKFSKLYISKVDHSLINIKKEVNMMNLNISKLHEELIEAWNRHDLKKVVPYYDENIVWKDMAFPQPFKGIQGASQYFNLWLQAFPDFKLRVVNRLVVEDMIAFEFEFTGTHTGILRLPGMELPPTNKMIKTFNANFAKIKNGKLFEVTNYPDVQGLMVQLGVQPMQAVQTA